MVNIDWDKVITQEQKTEQEISKLRAQQKVEKQQKVDAIIVIVEGMGFNGDEMSQGRMLRRAETMTADEMVEWVLADNSVALVAADQLRAAAREAVDEMGRIWVGTR